MKQSVVVFLCFVALAACYLPVTAARQKGGTGRWMGDTTRGKQALFIKIESEEKDSIVLSSSSRPLTGLTLPQALLEVDGKKVEVYSTGAFGLMLHLKPGVSRVHLHVQKDSLRRDTDVVYNYVPPRPAVETKQFRIDLVQVFPAADQHLVTGDVIDIRVKAQSGNKVSVLGRPLFELPPSQAGLKGIYQVSYTVRPGDTLPFGHLIASMTSPSGSKAQLASAERLAFNEPLYPFTGRTKGGSYLNYGLGSDRLGGAKLGYLDSLIRLKITAKSGNFYRAALSEHQNAWIPQEQVEVMPQGTFFPKCTTGNITTSSDSLYDYIRLNLCQRLAYSSDLVTGPTRLYVDVYGATSNTNWIVQKWATPTVKSLNTEQLEQDVFRITVSLEKEQSWGYGVYYEGSTLVVRIKHAPKVPLLSRLVVAVDAGHGGKNSGAKGITGVYEKNITLALSKELKGVLEQAGARVILTREADNDLSIAERVAKLSALKPDLLISVHANSSADPETAGTSTYYRYLGFRALSLAVYNSVIALGLKGYGNVGRFNFALNGPTEYPNMLLETAFLSSPSDEAKLLDPAFRTELALKVVEGVNAFLKQAK